jgi:hypothetical protein
MSCPDTGATRAWSTSSAMPRKREDLRPFIRADVGAAVDFLKTFYGEDPWPDQ